MTKEILIGFGPRWLRAVFTALVCVSVTLLVCAALWGLMMWATSEDVWHAGEPSYWANKIAADSLNKEKK